MSDDDEIIEIDENGKVVSGHRAAARLSGRGEALRRFRLIETGDGAEMKADPAGAYVLYSDAQCMERSRDAWHKTAQILGEGETQTIIDELSPQSANGASDRNKVLFEAMQACSSELGKYSQQGLESAAVRGAIGYCIAAIDALKWNAPQSETQQGERAKPVAWRTKRPARGEDWIYYEQEPDYPEGPVESLYLRTDAGSAKVPEGWKLVPVEPTGEMLDAADKHCTPTNAWRAYISMLLAAPSPSSQEQSE